MVQVDYNSLREGDCTIDLESGINAVINEEVAKSGNKYSNPVEASLENVEAVADKRFGGGEVSPPLQKKAAEGEKPKKKSRKKPPKPPRPPRAPSMDTADQIIAREMHEIAVMKRERARAERMKALKSMKNSKSASSSTNLFGLVITIIFCLVIIWQGLFSRGGSSVIFQGSPESSVKARGGFISVQFYKNVSNDLGSSSASPNNVELISGLDDREEAIRSTGYTVRKM